MSLDDTHDPQFEALLEYLHLSRGFDFTGYKRSSLMRRVGKRLSALSLDGYSNYLDYLQVHPDEFEQLFNTILINVTAFFRDLGAWEFLKNQIIPRILSDKNGSDSIRVWSAGCSSGEEAYSLAMVLAEHLGVDDFHERVKIYATDVDTFALAQARQATYSYDVVKEVPENLLEKYFSRPNSGDYVFNTDLRRAVIFGEHDLMQDAPISRLDLLACRNTLMYFNSEAQGRIISRFHFALNDGGILFLGKAEMLLTHANLFSPLDMKHRFFTRVPRMDLRENLLAMGQLGEDQISTRLSRLMRMRDLVFDNAPDAQLIMDPNGVLLAANEQAKQMFSISQRDMGGVVQEMEIYYLPVALKPLIDRATLENNPIMVADIETRTKLGETRFLDIHVIPLKDKTDHIIGTSVVYVDITRSKILEAKLKGSSTVLETTNEELQSTNEELETTNEELQSTVEELETTNEELQSTNEELETMNEELQSTNQELETLNDELGKRTDELNGAKNFLEIIMSKLKVGIAVVDPEFRIQNWNTHAEDLWGLRSDELIGKSILGLDIGLPVEKLKQPIRAVLEDRSEIQDILIESINRRGKTIQCRVTCTPFISGGTHVQGVVLMMEEQKNETSKS